MKKIKIKQVKSGIGQTKRQKDTLIGLGITKMYQVREIELTPQVEGMVNKVKHLLEVEEL